MDTSKNIGTMATRSESSVDMIEDAFIDYITPKNTNTMEKENKCFFSVSLENGITITGESPRIVYSFLSELDSYTFWATAHYEDINLPGLQEICKELNKQVVQAATTIMNNFLYNEED